MAEKLYFIRSPKGYGYHAGHVHEVPEDQAKKFKKSGVARPATKTLPKDIPGRKALIDAGYETIQEVKEISDFSEINGIGTKTQQELAGYLAKS